MSTTSGRPRGRRANGERPTRYERSVGGSTGGKNLPVTPSLQGRQFLLENRKIRSLDLSRVTGHGGKYLPF